MANSLPLSCDLVFTQKPFIHIQEEKRKRKEDVAKMSWLQTRPEPVPGKMAGEKLTSFIINPNLTIVHVARQSLTTCQTRN